MLEDIKFRIQRDFNTSKEIEEVEKIFNEIISFARHVGGSQVLRSILYLSNGNLEEVKKYYSMCCEDPRDVIGEAEERAGNPGHWFSIPFDEMKDFNGMLPEVKKEESEEDNLPF